jgi:hypothetical protein
MNPEAALQLADWRGVRPPASEAMASSALFQENTAA